MLPHLSDPLRDDEEYDEHVWTSPANALLITKEIFNQLCAIDEVNSSAYIDNFNRYSGELSELDKKISSMIEASDKNMIVIGDRFPLMYFTERYGLGYVSAFPGCSAQTEANPATLAKLIDTVENENIGTVFKVDLSKGSVAYTISEATGADVKTLYSCHVISAEDYIAGETYVSLMMRNYEAIMSALN